MLILTGLFTSMMPPVAICASNNLRNEIQTVKTECKLLLISIVVSTGASIAVKIGKLGKKIRSNKVFREVNSFNRCSLKLSELQVLFFVS